MTDSPRFELPEQKIDSNPTEQPAVAEVLPSSPAAPKSSRKSLFWIIPLILVSALLLTGIGYQAVSLGVSSAKYLKDGIQQAAQNASGDDDNSVNGGVNPWENPPIVGEPGSPVAREPLQCATPCFDEASIAAAVPPKRSLEELGLGTLARAHGTYAVMSAQDAYEVDQNYWKENGGSPDNCSFAMSFEPSPLTKAESDAAVEDTVYDLGRYEDDFENSIEQSARLFSSSKNAESYMIDLLDLVNECKGYTIQLDDEPYETFVEPMPDLGPPASVAAVGWIERNPGAFDGFFYGVDVQRGNMVVRTIFGSDSSISESRFRRFMNFYAAQIAGIEPLEK